jgi:hypothetical protein
VPAGVQAAENSNDGAEALATYAKTKKLKKCPSCRQLVEKSQGCNAITCRCGICFCYICGKQVPPAGEANPTAARFCRGCDANVRCVRGFHDDDDDERMMTAATAAATILANAHSCCSCWPAQWLSARAVPRICAQSPQQPARRSYNFMFY